MSLRRMMLFTLGAKIKNLVSAFKIKVLADLALFESDSCLEAQLNTINNQKLLNSASLVVTPNAYKAGKLYSVVPSDGTGDFIVTRATSATRVNSAGLIEIPVTNLVIRSEESENAIWTKANLSIIQNTQIAPNSSLTADTLRIGADASITRHRFYSQVIYTANTIYTTSYYLKKANHRWIQLVYVSTDFGANSWANFDLENGVIGNTGTGTIATITNVGNGWYRCTVQGTSTVGGSLTGCEILTINNINGVRYPSYQSLVDEDVCYVWGVQVEQNVSATQYIPTTSVVRTRFAGITQDGSIASNIPRIDYTNASCPSILVESQRTNLLLYSDMFSASPWTGIATIAPNTEIAPDNTLTADTLIDVATSYQTKGQTVSVPINSTATASVFIKKTTESISYYAGIAILFQPINVKLARLILNTTTGTFNLEGVTTATASAKVISVNNYWKVELTATDSVGNNQIQFLFYPAISLDGITITPLAQGSNVFWGAQLELGGNATSYIPTTTAAVTRNADVIKITNNINLIGQTEGTIYIKFYKTLQTEGLKTLFILSGTSVNSDSIQIITPNNTANISASIVVNNIVTGLSGGSRPLLEGLNKICLVYSTTGSKVFLNGVLAGTISNVGLPPMLNINLGSLDGFRQWGFLNDIVLCKTQITNAEAIQLTTL